MLGSKFLQTLFIRSVFAMMIAITSCTGVGKNATPQEGGITIAPGDQMEIDLQDVLGLGILEWTVALKTVSPDYQTSTLLYDLTAIAKENMNDFGQFAIIMPKSIRGTIPMLLVVDFPDLNMQMTDIVFDPRGKYRPGIASSLTYNLIKTYPAKALAEYNEQEFEGIKARIQQGVDKMTAESERLSLSGIPYKKLIRYYTNGFAFNIQFLNEIKQFGIDYGFSTTTPAGLLVGDTPEGSLSPYEYAINFTINGVPPLFPPFGQNNTPPRLLAGSAKPNPGLGLFIQEGKKISVQAAAFDLDDDFMDKDFIVIYTPRVLPTAVASNIIIPEPTPEYLTLTNLNAPNIADNYQSGTIGYNEALDTIAYLDGDTAYRDVYFMISDGMIRIPYHWNFKYSDLNRQPKVLVDAQGQMNDTSFDVQLQATYNDPPIAGVPGWLQHSSHCETDLNATPTPSGGGPSTINYYQRIHGKKDGPWSCAFRVIDPDLDGDPNAAPDEFWYSVANIDSFTQVLAGPLSALGSRLIWPPVAPTYTFANPRRISSTVLPTCLSFDGVTHYRCGLSLYQIVVDNGVKLASDQKSDLMYYYDAVIADRKNGGLSTQKTIGRAIEFDPNPPFLINYSTPSPAPLAYTVFDLVAGPNGPMHPRSDTYLEEILSLAGVPTGAPLSSLGLDPTLTDVSSRTHFRLGTPQEMSSYITQPHALCNAAGTDCFGTFNVTLDGDAEAVTGSPGAFKLFGHSFRPFDASSYRNPYEYDSTCSSAPYSNNSDLGVGWDQNRPNTAQYYAAHPGGTAANSTQTGGWTFEINVIDYDNVNLRSGEPSDPVYLTMNSNVANAINLSGVSLEYCWPNPPNLDPAYYQTYRPVGALPAVDPDRCQWRSTAPLQMQPMPIYYSGFDGNGNPAIRKWVYHRLRLKWQPKDQGLYLKSGLDPAGFIRNTLSGIQFYGNVFITKNGDTRDLTPISTPFELYATRKNFPPCMDISMVQGENFFHQLNPTLNPFTFGVQDENQTLWTNSSFPGAVSGRYEADLELAGSRSIQDPEFLKFVPYFRNCTTIDQFTPLNPSPTPPPGMGQNEAALWYTNANDPTDKPHIRFISQTNGVSPGAGTRPFCLNFRHIPLAASGFDFNEVWIIENTNTTTPHTLTQPILNTCAGKTSVLVHPEQKYFAVAAANGIAGCGGHTVGQILWSDADSTATVAMVIDPTLAQYGAFPAGTQMRLDYFPSIFEATRSTNVDSPNGLFFAFNSLDTFLLNPLTLYNDYVGFDKWIPADPANVGPSPTPSPGGYISTFQEVDWDNQALNLAIVTPTPNAATSNVFFRLAPGNSTHVQVFIKNHANASFPIQASDLSAGIENDPFDTMSYTFSVPPVPAPASTPVFIGITRPDCVSTPINYPTDLTTLNYTTLQDYKRCTISWTPDLGGSDDGKKFSYGFAVQDNFGATLTVMGLGGRHPSGSGFIIPNDNMPKANGPATQYFLDIESLENNTEPFFTSVVNGASLTTPYNSAGGGSGWTSVFPSSAPAGIAPSTCVGPLTGFSCTPGTKLALTDGDILQNATAISMTEGNSQAFTIFAKDTNITNSLKTLTAVKPTKVFIVDGPFEGQTYFVPSFASMTMSTSQNIAQGTGTFSFTWTPTDAEANYLSNTGGFLIPVVVTDQTYFPATDPGFPSQFTVPSMKKTLWIWCKLRVKNTAPSIYYMSGTTEVPLNGATLTMQTGAVSSFTIRVKDPDIARWSQSADTAGFNPNYSGPAFTTASPAGTPYLAAPFIIQEYRLHGNPTNSDLGLYNSPSTSITDPGDPSRGLALNPDAGSPPRAMAFPASNALSVAFNIDVIGKPLFLVPSPTPAASPVMVFAYSNKPFYYPLSLAISRPTEKLKPMFIGIDSSTAITPVKRALTGGTATGIYVNENHVLRWPDSSFVMINNPLDRLIPLVAVAAGYCNVGTPQKTIIRYNETTNTMESCGVNAANMAANASLTTFTIRLTDSSVIPSPSPISLTEFSRSFSAAPTPTDTTGELNSQFAEFIGRCTYCGVAPVTVNAAPSGYLLNPSSTTGSAQYNFNNFVTRIQYDRSPGVFTVQKTYQDTTPSTSRNIIAMANKGELLTFKATVAGAAIPASPYNQYRWYVNGCLKSAGQIRSNNLQHSFLVSSLMGGANNDCTGEYGFNEPGADALGQLVVRLAIVNGQEASLPSSESSTYYYVWKINVINSDPNLQTASTYAWSAPITLNASYTTGNQPVQFAAPVTYAGRNFFSFTDLSSVSGLKIRSREFSARGDLPVTGLANMLLNCDASFTSQPQWMGFHPAADGKLYFSASTNTSYPLGSSANAAYGSKSQTCFSNALTLAAPTQTYINYGAPGSAIPAGYLSFSRMGQSVGPLATYATTASAYAAGTNETSYYLLDGINGSYQFWSYALSGIYASTPAELLPPFGNNSVRRNIVSGSNLFQFIGASSAGATGWRGFIMIRTLAPGTFNKVVASGTNKIMFADPSSAAPTPAPSDCQFNGTPLDGVYVQSLDTLFVMAYASDSTGKGHMISITNATTSPTCNVIGDVLNPSLSSTSHNPNVSHMVYDSQRGIIYGIINQGTNLPGQLYTLDVFTKKLITRDVSATISPYELIYSPNINATYLFDNRRSTFPVLYRIW